MLSSIMSLHGVVVSNVAVDLAEPFPECGNFYNQSISALGTSVECQKSYLEMATEFLNAVRVRPCFF